MNVVDIPQACSAQLYSEAAEQYGAMVRGRSISVHRIGAPNYPGLSGLELLVLTDQVGVDNRFFFSALQRLPSKFAPLFAHEPFVLPAWSLRVLQHTRHRSLALVSGRDVLGPYAPIDEPDERWCRLLEGYCAHGAFHANVLASQTLSGRHVVEAANALRDLLAGASAELPEAADEQYGARLDAVQRTFFTQGDPAQRVREVWELFARAFARLDERFKELFAAQTTAQSIARARALLHGDEECAFLNREYAFMRARDIDGYHQELASLGLPFGHLFAPAAYPQAVRALPAMPLVDALVHNVYRVRRRLMEYSAAG